MKKKKNNRDSDNYRQKKNMYHPLTEQQEIFVQEYLYGAKPYVQVEAYMKAYPDCTRASAKAQASRLMARANIRAEIRRQRDNIMFEYGIDRQWIIDQYMDMMESCLDNNENIVDRTNWNKALAQLSKLLGLDEPDRMNINIKEFKAKFGS